MAVPSQPSPPKSAHKQALYKMRSSTKQSRSINSHYIHPLQYHTCSTTLAQLLIQEYYHHVAHLYHPVTGANETYYSLRDKYPMKWEISFSNYIGWLAQGVGTRMKTWNKSIFSIPRSKVPSGRNITYANPVCDYRPWKYDTYCIRLTISGDNLTYPSE